MELPSIQTQLVTTATEEPAAAGRGVGWKGEPRLPYRRVMVRKVMVALAGLTVTTVGLDSAALGQSPISLLVPQSTAFSILGHSCGGIQEQSFATGFDPVSGYPIGDVYMQTSLRRLVRRVTATKRPHAFQPHAAPCARPACTKVQMLVALWSTLCSGYRIGYSAVLAGRRV